MSIINNLDFHRIVSITSFSIIISVTILLFFFPFFSSNFFYEKGSILIYTGKLEDIPKGFKLCDGQNGTPDLRNKFVIGSWSSSNKKSLTPQIEDLNINNQIVGNGMKIELVNDFSKTIGGESIKGLSHGNIPFLFGTDYTSEFYGSNFEYIPEYDKGTNWFKNYEYTNRQSTVLSL